MSNGLDKKGHIYGEYESIKFQAKRAKYLEYQSYLRANNYDPGDLLENIGAFIGDLTLNRVLALHEYFQKTLSIAGHIADVGTYKGSSALLFAKFLQIFQAQSLWQVHGFDWFKGTPEMSPSDSALVPEGGYVSSKSELEHLVHLQELESIFRLHDLDLITDLEQFFLTHPHLQFRLVFMDCGSYDVMDSAIPQFWSRLTPGGIMIFDQWAHEFAPGEITAVRKHLPDQVVRTLPFGWMPNSYIVK